MENIAKKKNVTRCTTMEKNATWTMQMTTLMLIVRKEMIVDRDEATEEKEHEEVCNRKKKYDKNYRGEIWQWDVDEEPDGDERWNIS